MTNREHRVTKRKINFTLFIFTKEINFNNNLKNKMENNNIIITIGCFMLQHKNKSNNFFFLFFFSHHLKSDYSMGKKERVKINNETKSVPYCILFFRLLLLLLIVRVLFFVCYYFILFF